jgi:diguanylate cyclase (GGDEF)-like protein/PAS domain S-box-containing protein
MNQEEFYKKLVENLYDGIYFVDKNRKIIFWNKGAEYITGFKESEVKGRFCYDNILNHVNDDGCALCWNGCPLQKTNEDGITREVCVYLHHKNGHRIPVSVRAVAIYDGDEIIGSIEVFKDETENRKILENLGEFETQALYDSLTGLRNRRYLEAYIGSKINEFETLEIPFGIAFIDIDKFKDFNDVYGHDTGDEVLKMVARTFTGSIRNTDVIGRWGGEEFVAVFEGVDELNLLHLSEKIRMLVETSSIKYNDENIRVTISVGATIFKKDDTGESAIRRADLLMYQSKLGGRNKVTVG